MLVLEAFTRLSGPTHGPSEIAEATGLNVAVVYRILQSGIPSMLFVRVPPGRYRLGPGAAQIGMQAMANTPGTETSHPVLEHASRALDGFALLWVLSPYGGPHRSCADYAPGRYDFDALGLTATELVEVGSTLRVGASGRVIAAHLPAPMVASVLGEQVPAAAGPGVVRDPDDFVASLNAIQQAGYAVGREEIPGWDSIAAPVMWGDAIYGAVTILKPSSLMPKDLAVPIAVMTAAANRLSLLVSGGPGKDATRGRNTSRYGVPLPTSEAKTSAGKRASGEV
ncbi:IclR family transcriptional regulator C-terminal domain-containing protein [Streptomyces sp. NPDC006334]|uniref:IclR family transcriptional regulator n=1 Tax=Streptomyces sp. NPDC006334 TaxID=3156754 RepID=UPI00339DC2AE